MKKLLTLILILAASLLFAQLPETNIKISTVKNALGATTYELTDLATHANINKWSRKKPVNGTWPQSSTGTYGLDIANNWAYTARTGTYRLGDFRGYQHDATIAVPPIHVKASESESDNLYPYGSPSVNTQKIRAYRTAAFPTVIIPSLFTPNLDNYYYGFRITKGGNTYYKTYALVSSLNETGININLSATIVETTPGLNDWHFADLPQGIGAYIWAVIIASSSVPNWTATAPATVYVLPSGTFGGIEYASSGSFTVYDWLVPWPQVHNWDGINHDVRESTIYCEVGSSWTVNSVPSWISYSVGYYDVESQWVDQTSSGSWATNKIIRLDPAPPVTDRSGVAALYIGGNPAGQITLNQIAATPPPSFNLSDIHNTLLIANNGTTGTGGALSVTIKFTTDATAETDIYIKVINHGATIGTGSITVFSSGAAQLAINLTETLQNGVNYLVTLDDAP